MLLLAVLRDLIRSKRVFRLVVQQFLEFGDLGHAISFAPD
jgi:hypothetical protein